MHEAGLAKGIAAQIQHRRARGSDVRILVTNGHDEPAAFDDALRLHLAAAVPGLDVDAIEIVHRPQARLCGDCAVPFTGQVADPCPACGGAGVSISAPERIEIGWRADAARALAPAGSRFAGDRPPPGS